MLKIGEFSKLSHTTIKTLRFYEEEGLLRPSHIDTFTNYRYYETSQLIDLSKIILLRQIGCSLSQIKEFFANGNFKDVLNDKKFELENVLLKTQERLQIVNYMLKEKEMKREVFKKELPEHIVYYKEGVIKNYSDAVDFILSSAQECLKTNPNIKCVQPDYCFMSYLDGEYKEHDIKVKYSQAVEKMGVENETIKFEKLKPITALCIFHKGSYSNLRETYSYITKYIEDNGYKIVAPIREMYIDGMWNKEKEEDWLTEIQVPVEKL